MAHLWLAAVMGAALAGGSPEPAGARKTLPPEQVREAIAWGRSASEADLRQYELKTADTWEANFDTAFLRVAQLAAALRRNDKVLAEEEVPERLAADEVHVYLHVRPSEPKGDLPDFEYVTLKRPAPAAGRSEVALPRAFERFVRQVPMPGYSGPARLARSVRAVFPRDALVPGAELRVLFADQSVATVVVQAATLAHVR